MKVLVHKSYKFVERVWDCYMAKNIIIIIQLYSTGHKRKDIIKTVSDTTKLC